MCKTLLFCAKKNNFLEHVYQFIFSQTKSIGSNKRNITPFKLDERISNIFID